ncbi:MAG: chromosomal replication initiator protein DnaA [Leptospirales bacterium]
MNQSLWKQVLDRFREFGSEPGVLERDGILDLLAGSELQGEKGHYILLVGSTFIQRLVQNRYFSDLLAAIKEVTHNPETALEVQANAVSPPKKKRRAKTQPQAQSDDPASVRASGSLPLHTEVLPVWNHNLNSRYTFDNYVIGVCNQFAHAAAFAIANNPSRAYNPFYVFGSVGLGKTHLVNAIGNLMVKQFPSLKVLYITTESFLNEMVSSIKFTKMNEFRERYRKIDVLIMDDIQFLSGKERTQEELFYTFNALYENGKQIVLSSDCMPNDIPTLEGRLKSRFGWGLIADIQIPDFETKVEILKEKMQQERVVLPTDVVYFLANTVKSNIRELEGAMIRLGAYGNLMGKPITIEVARKLLSDLMPTARDTVSVERIIQEVAEYYKVLPKDVRSKKRHKTLVTARHMAVYLIRDLTQKSYPEIGRELGGRDHSTAIYSFKLMEERLESDPVISSDVGFLKKKLEQPE